MRANWADPEWRAKRCARLSDGQVARYAREALSPAEAMRRANISASMNANREAYVLVPGWVPSDLRDDYRDFTRLYGEEIAAREIRAMKAEARA
jgi:hypothetical protein